MTDVTEISATCQAEMSFVPLAGGLWENPPVSEAIEKRREVLRERLRDRLAARIAADPGYSARKLSLAIGANHSYVSQLLDGSGGLPGADKLDRLAEELGTSTDYLTGRADSAAPVHSEVAVGDRRFDFAGFEPELPGIPVVGTGDCADLEVCDDSGHMVEIERSSFDPDYHVRMIRRPAALRGNKDLYAVQFHGSSMEPRFEAGEIGIVDPRRPVGKGDDVLVQLRIDETDDVGGVLAKRLVRQTSADYVLHQFNPPLTFILPKARVVRIHRIMRQTDYLF